MTRVVVQMRRIGLAVIPALYDMDENLKEIRWAHEPKPWADGTRPLYIRLRWREITGRRIG